MTLEETFLEPGHYHCPSCASTEKSFSVFVTLEGDMRGVCHRASCGYRSGALGGPLPERRQAPGRYSRAYVGEFGTAEQTLAVEKRIRERFGVAPTVWCTPAGEPLLPVMSPSSIPRGFVKRAIFWGETGTGPKTVYYPADLEAPSLSWHGGQCYPPVIVLVEDQVSAWKVAASGFRGVALLGNALNAEKVREIARNGGTQPGHEVIIALDADATALAFEQARKWGMAFRRCRVAILQRDLKDEAVEDIPEILGL